MNLKAAKIPFTISEYIINRFRDEFLFEVKEIKQAKGQTIYSIEISKDNYIYTLQFNETGKLLKDDAGEAYPADAHDEPGFENIPE